MPNELYGRFSAKSDFIKYFKENRKNPCSLPAFMFQSSFFCPPSICWTRTSSKKFLLKRKSFFDLMKSKEYVFLSTMSLQWSNSGLWWNQTRSWWSFFRQKWRRVEFQIESTSSMFSILFRESIFRGWSDTRVINVTSLNQWPRQKRLSKSLMTGGIFWTVCLLFLVSQRCFDKLEKCVNFQITFLVYLNRTQRQNSSLTQN